MEQGKASRSYAPLVAAGILLSRLAGLVRDRVFAHYLGNTDAADAFRAAFRIPNVLQNLFGEGVLSASFIPVYANLLAQGKREEADRVASAIFWLLALVMSGLVLVGVLATPWLIDAIAPGFSGAKRDLTVRLVRILFPGAALLALSAWCLGILNSHRRFFLSYAAPVVWNAAIIAALIGWGGRLNLFPLTFAVAWGAVAGSALQFAIQLPPVIRLMRSHRLWLGRGSADVRMVVRNFLPAFVSRGVVQISAYIDTMIASFLSTGALAGLSYAQTLYMLPISLFGMSVSAAELPEMSSAVGETRSSSGRSWLGRGWACWPPPWPGCTRRLSMPSRTRARPSSSPSSGSAWSRCRGIPSRSTARRPWASPTNGVLPV
jgi:putative peptidoglycan lipid II flippase